MDAFFASVEQRDHPDLQGKPIAVGGNKDRGVVAAASYEARKFGVKSAMPSVTAAKLCPSLIFVPPRFEVYKEVSNSIRKIFEKYTHLIEPLSLDEAYLDVTENHLGINTATEIAERITKEIQDTLNLTASAGVSYNKFIAKIASDINKPNGIFVIPPSRAQAFLEKMEVRKFFGIGKVTAKKLLKMGVIYGSDLKKLSLQRLDQEFGKAGKSYYHLVRGIDNRPVNPDRIRKSVGTESTFESDLYDIQQIAEKTENVAQRLWKRIEKLDKRGRTITLKIKFKDFTQITRSHSHSKALNSLNEVQSFAKILLNQVENLEFGIRLVGLSISNFEESTQQEKINKQLTLDF